jgi:hypothetical protein
MRRKRTTRALLHVEDKSINCATNTHERKRWYANTARAYQRIIAVVDPFPQERRRSKDFSGIAEILPMSSTSKTRIAPDFSGAILLNWVS